MVNEKTKRITGYAHVEIDGSDGFRTQVTIDFNERSLIFSVPHAKYALPTDMPLDAADMEAWLKEEGVTITCYFDMRVFSDGQASTGVPGTIIKMFDCRDPSIISPMLRGKDLMRVLYFTHALQSRDASQMPEVFDAVSVSFTDRDLLIGDPPELRHPVQYIEPYDLVFLREKEEQVTITLTHEPPKTLKWKIEGGDNELTISIWRQTTIDGRHPHMFAPIRGITIKAMNPISHYDLIEKGVAPLMAFATLLLGANVNIESLTFWFDGGRKHSSSADHHHSWYRNETAPSYDARSTSRSKTGILYDAIEHAADFFTAYRKIQLPINQIRDALNAPLYHVTGARLLAATGALQGIVKHFDNENARTRLEDALEKAIVQGDYTALIANLLRERHGYAHGNTEQAKAHMNTIQARFDREHFSLNLAIEYLLVKAGLPEEIIKRARADEMPFSMLYPIDPKRKQ